MRDLQAIRFRVQVMVDGDLLAAIDTYAREYRMSRSAAARYLLAVAARTLGLLQEEPPDSQESES